MSLKSADLGCAFGPPYYQGIKLYPKTSPLGWIWCFKKITFWCYRQVPKGKRSPFRIDYSDKARTSYPSRHHFTEALMSVFDKHLDELKAIRLPDEQWQDMLRKVIEQGEGVAA
jgi:hypothetical protein